MKRLFVILLFSMLALGVTAQKVYFVYVQSEDETPFYIKMGERVYNSTSSGYLIVSQLYDTIYTIRLGFPQDKLPEQKFTITINSKDHGFILKNITNKGWALYDLQTLEVLFSSAKTVSVLTSDVKGNKNDSGFSDILAKATGDPSIRENNINNVVQLSEKSEGKDSTSITLDTTLAIKEVDDEVQKIERSDIPDTTILAPSFLKNENDSIGVIKKDSPEKNSVLNVSKLEADSIIIYSKSIVIKRSESSTTDGFGLIFIDQYPGGLSDTIKILIPDTKSVSSKENDKPRQEIKFIEMGKDTTRENQKETSLEKDQPDKSVINKNNNHCKSIANEGDFFELRKKMASVQGEEGMISEAKEYFAMKCFSTDQVRNLGSLFLTDEGKYRFFDIAYKFVIDPVNYIVLQRELKDEYYINRFKAMLK